MLLIWSLRTYLPAMTNNRASAFSSRVTSVACGSSNHEKISFSFGVICSSSTPSYTSRTTSNLRPLPQHSKRPLNMCMQRLRRSRRPCNQIQCPREMSKDTQRRHALMQHANRLIFLALFHHAKTSIEAYVAHDIETVEIHPIRNAHTRRCLCLLF
jgi:hypothetical protein